MISSQRKISVRCNTQSSKSINVGGDFERLPIELIIEIFARLPAKSTAKFRCLSKLWASILRRPYFTELFLTSSSSRPQVLFAYLKGNDVLFFSMPEPQNHHEKSYSVAATYVRKIPFRGLYKGFSHVNGFVFLTEVSTSKPRRNHTPLASVICNPSTGQSLAMPKVTEKRKLFFGYDPSEKQYKVLSMTWTGFKILTLGSENSVWRDIVCSTKHYHVPMCDGICVNGVLYYRAGVKRDLVTSMVVCFDFRSEEFHFMNVEENFIRAVIGFAFLINYNGKLGSLMSGGLDFIDERSKTFELWVLEDLEKHEWSRHIHVVPPLWKVAARKDRLYFVGVIGTDEIVLRHLNYFYYYNIKRNTAGRVEIKGVEGLRSGKASVFLNYVENLKLIQAS